MVHRPRGHVGGGAHGHDAQHRGARGGDGVRALAALERRGRPVGHDARAQARQDEAAERLRHGLVGHERPHLPTLCGGPRSQNDYLEIASRFHTVILSSIPQMSAGMSSEARRFTWLIDVFYDNKVKLIMSAEVAPELLYTQGTLSNEFHRTVSRIIEMQSQEYMNADQREIHAMLDTPAHV